MKWRTKWMNLFSNKNKRLRVIQLVEVLILKNIKTKFISISVFRSYTLFVHENKTWKTFFCDIYLSFVVYYLAIPRDSSLTTVYFLSCPLSTTLFRSPILFSIRWRSSRCGKFSTRKKKNVERPASIREIWRIIRGAKIDKPTHPLFIMLA